MATPFRCILSVKRHVGMFLKGGLQDLPQSRDKPDIIRV